MKSIMQIDCASSIYGKTGSSANGQAWFIGFTEVDSQRKYFAIYIDDSTNSDQISGTTAKEIAIEIMK